MSIVHGVLPDATVLDLCAGSGALGIEALSRGARHATFVESNARVLRTLRENIALVGAEDRSTIVRGDALRFVAALGPLAFDVAFADPPYATDLAAEIAEQWQLVPFARLLGVEHASRGSSTPRSSSTPRTSSSSRRSAVPGDTRRYGDSAITFYRVASETPPEPSPA